MEKALLLCGGVLLWIAKLENCTRWRANWIRSAINAYCSITQSHLENSFWVKDLYSCKIMTQSILINHHHHIALVARISLTLSRHSSLSFIAPVSSHSCWMYVRAGRPAFARPCVGVHKSTSLMSSSLLLQQCPACLAHQIKLCQKYIKK